MPFQCALTETFRRIIVSVLCGGLWWAVSLRNNKRQLTATPELATLPELVQNGNKKSIRDDFVVKHKSTCLYEGSGQLAVSCW